MAPSNLPSQTQGLSTLPQQLPPLQQQQTPSLQSLTQHLASVTPPIAPAPYTLPSLLTPSGRQIAQGGTVRNVTGDDTNAIYMFWPDNEPLPDPGQCRPSGLLCGLGGNGNGPLPPILNTGNKGPIESQPGDWTCRKCEYLVSILFHVASLFFFGIGDPEDLCDVRRERLSKAVRVVFHVIVGDGKCLGDGWQRSDMSSRSGPLPLVLKLLCLLLLSSKFRHRRFDLARCRHLTLTNPLATELASKTCLCSLLPTC